MADDRSFRIEYYAQVREAMGCAAEDIARPAGVATAGDLVAWLRARSDAGNAALGEDVRIAVDDVVAQPSARLDGATTIALFPPMTGG